MRKQKNPQIQSSVNGLCNDDDDGPPQKGHRKEFKQLCKDPPLKNSMQNWKESASAGAGAKLILDTLGNSKIPLKHNLRFSALTGRLRKVIQSDKINYFGNRSISDGKL